MSIEHYVLIKRKEEEQLMKIHQIVQQPATNGQMKGLFSALVGAIPSTLTFHEAQYLIGRQRKIIETLEPLYGNVCRTVKLQHDWAILYQQALGMVLDGVYNVDFPEDYFDSEHLLICSSLDSKRLYQTLKTLQKMQSKGITLIGMDEGDLFRVVDHDVLPNVRDEADYRYGSAYLLKVSNSFMKWTASMEYGHVTSANMREHYFTLREMLLYALRYYQCDNYGPVACASSSLGGGTQSIIAFEKINGEIRIFPVQKDSNTKMAWPVLSVPVLIDTHIYLISPEQCE